MERTVKTAVTTLNGVYGVPIHIKEASGRQVQFEFETTHFVSAWTMPDITRRGGRTQRSYKVKQTGMAALRHSAPTAGPVCAALNRYGERLWAGELTG